MIDNLSSQESNPQSHSIAASFRSDKQSMHVIVGMSGGVDSAVAALLLKQQGYQVSGLFMQNWEDDDEHCTARQDYRDASAVASQLRIELTTVNFADEYWQRVFAHFLDEYGAGRTPNPDILCNKEIKFKAFLDHARGLGADAIATGHYARCGGDSQNVCLLRGHDENKDQSYFLYTLGQQQLKPSIFPVGQLPKSDVRRLARDSGFHLHGKKDSTGICFIGERKFNRFLAEYLPAQPGRIVSEDGSVMGQHNGLMFYTLGQRQGLGIGGQQSASPAPWYVLAKNLKDNELVIGQGHDHPALLRTHLQAHDVHWVQGNAPSTRFNCTARVRYRQQDQDCRVQVDSKEKLNIHFVEPVRAATPGQSIVFYNGDTCLGGAIVSDFDQVPVNS